ncbi:MAG: hypothetical protein KKI02_11720 [Planctomycetes bacterium]|nr:hypothetical protein [Planctomycetota bacterium]
MTAVARSLSRTRFACILLATAVLSLPAEASIINIQSSQLHCAAELDYGWGSSGSVSYGIFGPIATQNTRGTVGAGAAYSYGIDWNGPYDVGDCLEVFMPYGSGFSVMGYAVDPDGSSFFSRSEMRNHDDTWTLLIEPSPGETFGTPVYVEIETRLSGQLAGSGPNGIAQAQFTTVSDGGVLLDETLIAVEDRVIFDMQPSHVFESAIGEEFNLQFSHTLQVSGDYGELASAAFAYVDHFSLTVTVTPIPEPNSLSALLAMVGCLAIKRAIARR